jgi:hypothetical protein
MKILIEKLEKIIADSERREKLGIPEDLNMAEMEFQIDCILNHKVSEGRKENNTKNK